MAQAFLYTRFKDNGVTVLHPAPECLRALSQGGYWGKMRRGFLDEQIERQVRDGRDRKAAARFSNALAWGCGNSKLALEILRDRDCAHRGFNIELIDTGELPDRWFRDAWIRSPNGGPVSINLEHARTIQLATIRQAVADARTLRARGLLRCPRIRVPWTTIESAVNHARDEDELRRVWPEGIPLPGQMAPH